MSSLPSIDRIALPNALWTSIVFLTGTLPAGCSGGGEEDRGVAFVDGALPGTTRLSPAVAGVMVSGTDETKEGFGLSERSLGFTTSGSIGG